MDDSAVKIPLTDRLLSESVQKINIKRVVGIQNDSIDLGISAVSSLFVPPSTGRLSGRETKTGSSPRYLDAPDGASLRNHQI